jgi:hypothetical protein
MREDIINLQMVSWIQGESVGCGAIPRLDSVPAGRGVVLRSQGWCAPFWTSPRSQSEAIRRKFLAVSVALDAE